MSKKHYITEVEIWNEFRNIRTLIQYGETEMKKRIKENNVSAGKRSRKALRAAKNRMHEFVIKFVEFEKQSRGKT